MTGGLIYLLVGGAAVAGYFTVPGMKGNGLVFNLIGLSAAAAIVVGTLRNRPKRRLPWMLFAAAQVSFVIGDLLYYVFDAEFPSVGDLFYLAVYPLLVAGLLMLIRDRTPWKDRASLLDASIITVGVGLLAWVFLIDPYTRLSGLGQLERVMSIAYPLMDVLLLAVAARLAVGSGIRTVSFYLIGTGIVGLLATDAAYAYFELHGGYQLGSLLDIGWLAYYLLWGTAALLPGMWRMGEQSPESGPTLTGRRLVPLAAATLIAPAVGIVQSVKDAETAFSVSAAASAVLFLLVLARMTGLVKSLRMSVAEEQRAVFRESVLRRAALALGGAAGRDDIERVAADAARDLTVDASALDVTVEVRPPSGPVGLPPASGCVIDVPIASQASDHGAVRIVGSGALPAPVLASLEALAVQAAVALERAALAEDLLRRRSDERITVLAQQASDVITVLAADLTVQHQVASAHNFLRYEPGALIGSRLVDLVHPDDVAAAEAFFDAVGAHAGVGPETEFRVFTGGDTWVPVEAVGNNLLDDPRVAAIVVTIRDVSKRKVLEDGLKRQVAELQQLDQLKSDLVSTVSHELRTPLSSLIGHVEMLGDGDLGDLTSDQRWAVQAIDRNSQRLLSLIEDLLTLAKIETGGFGLSLAPTDVGPLIDEVKAAVGPMAATRSIDLGFDVDPGVAPLMADRSGVERVLMNLLTNAVKFTPEQGTVRLRVSCDETHALFSVSDTGIGMSEEDRGRLFTRFFRSTTATSMAIQGTGLGLAIVKKIVDDHGGTIAVESALGAGTTVTFTIPLISARRRARMAVGSRP